MNIYTREILSLMGGIKEIHEGNCNCSGIFTARNRGRDISEEREQQRYKSSAEI